MSIVDWVGPDAGMYLQGSGVSSPPSWVSGTAGDVGPAHDMYEAACGRGKMASAEYGRDGMRWQHQYSPSRDNHAIGDTYLHMKRAFGHDAPFSAAERATYWQTAAAGTSFPNGHNVDAYLLDYAQTLVNAGLTRHVARTNREASNSGNEAPILTASEAANNVTLWRRVGPQMKAIATAGGVDLRFLWNACGGPDTDFAGQLLGFPGWVDDNGNPLIDAIGPDVYSGTSPAGTYPLVPLWKMVSLAQASAIGATSIVRASYQAPLTAGDVVTVGVGRANAETATVAATTTTTTVTFTAPLTKTHAVGDRVTHTYAVGELCHWYGVVFRSKTAGNLSQPSSNGYEETTDWAPVPVRELPADILAAARTKWRQAFNRAWYGKDTSGNVTATFYVQRWYDFARGNISGFTFDPRVDPATVRDLLVYLPEWGVMGRPDTKAATSGDAFGWVMLVITWMAAMKARDGQGVAGGCIWNHNDGTLGAFRSVYSLLPPDIAGTAMPGGQAPGRYFPAAGDAYLALVQPSAQIVRTGGAS